MNGLRVLVVASDPLARAGLAALLEGRPECTVVGQVSADANLADELAIYRPDVVVWDLGWDPAPILSADEDRLAEGPEAPIPVVALLPDDQSATDAWTAGARGLLLRDVAAEELVAALQAVASGLIVLDPAMTSAVLAVREPLPELLVEELTPRELEVLQLLAEGLSNKAIGRRLEISEHTVKFHVNAILGKLGAQSRTEAVVRATRLGLIIL
jgi:two-component system nitrate/nitrite response regulator NarL